MTEGTSQGLFIVVAIVIFGIFVSLSYTLFGKEGISNDLTELFTKSIEQTKVTRANKNILENSSFKGGYNWSASHGGSIDWLTKNTLPYDVAKSLPNNVNTNIAKLNKRPGGTATGWGYLNTKTALWKDTKLKTGDTITISAWVYVPEDVPVNTFAVGFYDTQEDGGWINTSLGNSDARGKWTYISTTKKVTNDSNKIITVGFKGNAPNKDMHFYCAGMKVEYGEKQTEYNPT